MNEDRASRYHRLRRRAAVVSTACGVVLLVTLVVTGRSVDLAEWARGVAAPMAWPLGSVVAISVYVAVLAGTWEILSFPLVFYRSFLLDRKYGLSSEPAATWLGDHFKALGLGLGLTLPAAVAVYGAMRVSPG